MDRVGITMCRCKLQLHQIGYGDELLGSFIRHPPFVVLEDLQLRRIVS